MGCGASHGGSGTSSGSSSGSGTTLGSPTAPDAYQQGERAAPLPPAQPAPPAVVIDAQMAARLQELGSTASLELSPAQAHSPKLKYTLVGALDDAAANRTAPPLQHGTRVFVNMVKKSIEHFAEVGAAAAALRDRGMIPVAHLPASRFDSEEQLESTLAELARQTGGSDGDPPDVLLLGGKTTASIEHTRPILLFVRFLDRI